MARVSVIVPAYNAGDLLAEALRSVEAQTYADWEVVVADDGSTDDTLEVARRFDGRVRVLQGPGNTGPAAARNRAIAVARGELLVPLDADDFLAPAYLEEQVALYDQSARRPGAPVGIVACDAYVVDADGRVAGRYSDDFPMPRGAVTVDVLLDRNPIFVSALTPRTVVEEVGGYAEETWGSEDHDLWLRIVERGYRVVSNSQPLAHYRRTAASVSTSALGMARTNQTTFRRALARGRLTAAQRRVAERQIRLNRAVEEYALTLEERERGELSAARIGRRLPLWTRAAVENAPRWPHWARKLRGRTVTQAR